MGVLSRTFIRGLMILIPITVTVYVLYWLGSTAESLLGRLLQASLPEQYYIPGMGLLSGFLLVLLAGFLGRAQSMRHISHRGEKALVHVPLVRTIYLATKDLVGFVQRAREGKFNQVVIVTLGDPDYRIMGFVTRDDFRDMPPGLAEEHMIAVYFPMSYQVGGYTVMMPRSAVKPIDISVTEAMKFALTAGMTTIGGNGTPQQ